MTLTFCADRTYQRIPGSHRHYVTDGYHRMQLQSARFWWAWFAVGWYRCDDHDLIVDEHGWIEE